MALILIGFMGAGKSTVAAALADRLGCPQADLDALVTADAGMSIPEIFAAEGEAGFRTRESRLLTAALHQPGILATGGGTACAPANADRLAASDVPIVLLDASPATVQARIGGDDGRPLAQKLGVQGLADLQAQRNPRYRALADLVVATDTLTPAAIAERITNWLALRAMGEEA